MDLCEHCNEASGFMKGQEISLEQKL